MSTVVQGMQAIAGRIAQIEGRLRALEAPPGRPVASRSFAQALQTATLSPAVPTAQLKRAPASGTSAAYDGIVQQAAARYGLDPALVHAVIRAESDYNPRCRSHAGAMGLMQLMPETCQEYGIGDPYDPAQNITGGCRELSEHLKQFEGNVELALAAYNAGPNAVRRYGGIPPYRETQAYVPRVMGYLRAGGR